MANNTDVIIYIGLLAMIYWLFTINNGKKTSKPSVETPRVANPVPPMTLNNISAQSLVPPPVIHQPYTTYIQTVQPTRGASPTDPQPFDPSHSFPPPSSDDLDHIKDPVVPDVVLNPPKSNMYQWRFFQGMNVTGEDINLGKDFVSYDLDVLKRTCIQNAACVGINDIDGNMVSDLSDEVIWRPYEAPEGIGFRALVGRAGPAIESKGVPDYH